MEKSICAGMEMYSRYILFKKIKGKPQHSSMTSFIQEGKHNSIYIHAYNLTCIEKLWRNIQEILTVDKAEEKNQGDKGRNAFSVQFKSYDIFTF